MEKEVTQSIELRQDRYRTGPFDPIHLRWDEEETKEEVAELGF